MPADFDLEQWNKVRVELTEWMRMNKDAYDRLSLLSEARKDAWEAGKSDALCCCPDVRVECPTGQCATHTACTHAFRMTTWNALNRDDRPRNPPS